MYTRGFTAALAALLASTVSAMGGSKKSKAGSMTVNGMEAPFCPRYTGTSSAGSGKKSKAGTTAASCKGDTDTLECDSTVSGTFVLTENLDCSGDDNTIVITGRDSLLDCQGFTIKGEADSENESGGDPSNNVIVLEDGASIVNCNIIGGYRGIATVGDGCTTIENVSVKYAGNEGIFIQSEGQVIVKDVDSSYNWGDGLEVQSVDDDLYVAIQNFRGVGNHEDGLCFQDQDPGDDVEVELFGEIYIEGPLKDGIEIRTNNDVTAYGHVTVLGSGKDNGLNIDGAYISLTFAEGSSGIFCENADEDIEISNAPGTDLTVETGAVLICDQDDEDGDSCTSSCTDYRTRAQVCVD